MDFIRLAEQFVAKDAWMDPSTKVISHDPTMGSTGRKRYPEVWSDNHLATAKNDYKCNHCDKPIKTGDKYFRWEWKTGSPVRSHEHHRTDPKSMTKGLDSSEALELLKDWPAQGFLSPKEVSDQHAAREKAVYDKTPEDRGAWASRNKKRFMTELGRDNKRQKELSGPVYEAHQRDISNLKFPKGERHFTEPARWTSYRAPTPTGG